MCETALAICCLASCGGGGGGENRVQASLRDALPVPFFAYTKN